MFAPKDKKELIVPVRLDLDSTFNFRCERDISCFTKCCRDAYIQLTPYDVIRMKRRLEVPSDQFLAFYTFPKKIENTELPIPVLKMLDNEEKRCPFLGQEGCVIYDERPETCRYYPIGSGIFHNKDAAADERFFALIKEPHCLGHDMGQEWTVSQWIENQGLQDYDEVNKGWIEIILKRKSLGPFVTIPEKTLQMFFMACYDVDTFKRFIFQSKFLDIFEVPQERLKKMEKDDLALLQFGFDWLKKTLYGEGDLQIKHQEADGDMVEVDA